LHDCDWWFSATAPESDEPTTDAPWPGCLTKPALTLGLQ
jgi:hypothetical protein